MDPIIRAAAVSPTARQLRRLPDRTVAAPAPARPASPPAVAPLQAAPLQAPFGVAPGPMPDPAAATVAAAKLAAEHQVALDQRDAVIEKLRKSAEQDQADLAMAHADAERRGYAAGEEKGERAAREVVQLQVDRLKSLVFQISQARTQVMADSEDVMIEIVFAGICRIVGEQGANRETVQRIVREALATSRDRDQLVVRLHPDDVETLRMGAAGPEQNIRIEADAGISLGGCVVDSGTGSLDLRFETQLELLSTALREVRAGRHVSQDEV